MIRRANVAGRNPGQLHHQGVVAVATVGGQVVAQAQVGVESVAGGGASGVGDAGEPSGAVIVGEVFDVGIVDAAGAALGDDPARFVVGVDDRALVGVGP